MQGTGVNSLIQEDLYATEQLNLCATTTEPVALEPASGRYLLKLLKPDCPRAHAPQEKPPQWEARALESSPCSPQLRESPRVAMRTQHSQKQIKKIIFKIAITINQIFSKRNIDLIGKGTWKQKKFSVQSLQVNTKLIPRRLFQFMDLWLSVDPPKTCS